MPGFLLHQGATVLCSHAGQAQPTAVNPRVTVSGQPIVTQASVYAIAGCTLPPPPAANGPCVTAQWISAATRVTASGIPVLLLDSQALCAPTGTPLMVAATQVRARAM
ncbi:MAG: PAAR-like protein [Almyronema sp.]